MTKKDASVVMLQALCLIGVFMLIVLLGGCSTVEIGAKYVSDYYCGQSVQDRAVLGYNVNTYIAPDHIVITCADRPELPDDIQ